MSLTSKFQFLMPSYNQAHYIGDAIRSILAQDDPDWELWIVDNSSDETPRLMREFNDPRIHFTHIPERMDPGSCLNWMLDRITGQYFSYVHTDNNLYSSYVRLMRAALQSRPLGLAYCDMKVINEAGRHFGVFRRGAFDLPRLFSIDTLGVPFAATTELARRVGGFSAADFADDVRFCVSAYGLADYVHLPEPLIDYRLHEKSRTEEAGGSLKMQRVFANLMPKIAPALAERGISAVAAMEVAIKQIFRDLDLLVEDYWYRIFSKAVTPWWQGPIRVDHFFFAGAIEIPGFSSKLGRPHRGPVIRDESGRICVLPWKKRWIRHQMRRHREVFRPPIHKVQTLLPVWACLKVHLAAGTPAPFRVASADFRTILVARTLQHFLGWIPRWDAAVRNPPDWLPWDRATGDEAKLDCQNELVLSSTEASNA